MIYLRLGDWQTTMADVECDALITDPPYSARTHEGQPPSRYDGLKVRDIAYDSIDRDYCHAFVQSWAPRVRYWWVFFGDHTSCEWWRTACTDVGLVTFANVVWIKVAAAPRMGGDGPASQVEHIAIARSSGRWATDPPWGSLPGWYQDQCVRSGPAFGYHGITGAKPSDLMRALVRDYSRPGWTIADPHAGSGTTLVAARAEGRHCIGSEKDPKTYEIARKRLAQPFARELFQRMAE